MAPDSGRVRVLLVEDNPGDARLVRVYLQDASEYPTELTWAQGLEEAFDVLGKNAVDVVLLDLGLPESQGLDTLLQVQARVPLTPVVVLTGMDDSQTAVRAVGAGAQDFLSKGELNPPVLVRAIRYAIERMGAWRALQESEAKYQDLYENAPEMLASLDPMEGNILDCNNTLARSMGCSKEDLMGSRAADLYHPRSRERFEKVWQEFLGAGSIRGAELELQTRSGGVLDVLLNITAFRGPGGKILFGRASLQDITDRKAAERALRDSARLLRIQSDVSDCFLAHSDGSVFDRVLTLLLEATASGFGLFGSVDQEGDLVVRALKTTGELRSFGTEMGMTFGRTHWESTFLGNAMAEGRSLRFGEGSFAFPDDPLDLQNVLAVPVLENGRAVGLLCVANKEDGYSDLDSELFESIAGHMAPILHTRLERDRADNERRKAERELRNLNLTLEDRVRARTAELAAANQELESFSYSVSHDLRGPLRAIDGFSRILQEDYGERLDGEGRRLLNVVRDNTALMSTLIDDLLEFSRAGRSPMVTRAVDMTEVVGAVVEDLRESGDLRGSDLQLDPLPPAEADPRLIRQVWVNLIANAAKFSRGRASPRIQVSGSRENGTATYSVSDNGVGFDMAYQEKLFSVFERLHHRSEFEGSGVGLALSKRIVERHGGSIWGEGRVGEGATFFFSLPAAGGRPA